MSELRRDPITQEWVLLSNENEYRPLASPAITPMSEVCPLCPGQEALTPPEILARRVGEGGPNSAGWRLRVIPHRAPLFRVEEAATRRVDGPLQAASTVGAHEIVIETTQHNHDWWDFSAQELWEVLLCWRERLLDLRKDQRLRHSVVWRSVGPLSGATLSHPHSQIIAMPFWAPLVTRELHGARAYFEEHHRCPFCELLEEEARREVRVVVASDEVIALAPYASRRPFALRIFLRRHLASFEATEPQQLLAFAAVLRASIARLGRALDRPSYSLALVNAPYAEAGSASFHWYIEILPALHPPQGLEAAFGCAVNPTAPESAAAFLREVTL